MMGICVGAVLWFLFFRWLFKLAGKHPGATKTGIGIALRLLRK